MGAGLNGSCSTGPGKAGMTGRQRAQRADSTFVSSVAQRERDANPEQLQLQQQKLRGPHRGEVVRVQPPAPPTPASPQLARPLCHLPGAPVRALKGQAQGFSESSECKISFCRCLVLVVLGTDPRASPLRGKCSTLSYALIACSFYCIYLF